MIKPSDYHKEGFNCAEAIIKAFNENNNTNIPISLGSGMGTGFTIGSTCGAIGGATVVIGYLKGREGLESPNEARKLTRELMNDIREHYGTDMCKELKKNGVSCAEIIDSTYSALERIIK